MQILHTVLERLNFWLKIKKLVDKDQARKEFDAICKLKWANNWYVTDYKKIYKRRNV
jgi:hypothetical protein